MSDTLIQLISSRDKKFRPRRRVADDNFRASIIRKYEPVQRERMAIALRGFIERPGDHLSHIQEFTGGMALSLIYGYDVTSAKENIVQQTHVFHKFVSDTLLPGGLLVNALPFLGNLPAWVLGSEYCSTLKDGKEKNFHLLYDGFNYVKDRLKEGTARHSLVADGLAKIPEGDTEGESVLADIYGISYAAASDTVSSYLSSFVLAMVLHPEVQARAFAELDKVVGRDRLPEFTDRSCLPYIEAIIMEVLRWHPAVPQGVPHATEQDVIYGDYFIPKGAMILGNTWGIFHNEEDYPEPEKFKPERHLAADGTVIPDPLLVYAFGFGTRRCPGRHFADAVLWIFVTSVLSAFEIVHAKDENGVEIPVQDAYNSDKIINHPLPFACDAKPRDANTLELIERAVQSFAVEQ